MRERESKRRNFKGAGSSFFEPDQSQPIVAAITSGTQSLRF
jgi:hypothetical protein